MQNDCKLAPLTPVGEFRAFLRKRLGPNWVIHRRRTPRIVEKYGEDVVCITLRQFRKLMEDYTLETGKLPF